MPNRIKSYDKELLDPQWQRCRLKVLEYADFKCQLCGNGKMTLHVHHSYYTRDKKPWEYPIGSMIVLCEKHHSWYHDLLKGERLVRLSRGPHDPELAIAVPAAPPKSEAGLLSGDEVADFIAGMRRQLMSEGA